MRSRAATTPPPCPCGSGRAYAACCQPLHEGLPAPDAERLMRSRYSAWVLRLVPYLLATWHPSTRPATLEAGTPKWLGLQIRRHVADGDTATVEFVARCSEGGRAQRLHEISRFLREQGRWYYLDGEFPA